MLPWLLLAGLGAYVVLGSSPAAAAPSGGMPPPLPPSPLPPVSPSPVGVTPAPLPTPANASALGFSGPLGPALQSSGTNADPMAPWYQDPYGPPSVPLSNMNLVGPAATSTGPYLPPPEQMHSTHAIRARFSAPPRSPAQARAASHPSAVTRPLRAPFHSVGSGTHWGHGPVPQWTADGRAIFRATNGALRYFGPWPFSGYALDPAMYATGLEP